MSIKTALIHGVLTIELARPEKKNALTSQMYVHLTDAFKLANQDSNVRSVLLTGQPGIFSSGNDLEDFMQRSGHMANAPVFDFMQALIACEKPVVAAVTGAAIGIGATMLAHCDFVYISDEARLCMPFVSLGLVPEFGASLWLAQGAGAKAAAEKLLLGDPFTGADAVDYGLANAVLPAAEVLSHARRIAERFNALPAGAVRETKKLMRQPQVAALQQALAQEAQVFMARLTSPEAREAICAFLEKRTPNFEGLDDRAKSLRTQISPGFVN
jgi:enoyl-CoA hydratase/carnithine racemase